ncbi:MAG: CRISPR-associated protein Cas4 [Coriobacteriia bacterium]|nr:CRISPR-associated protein Cas4 [Coriobacteriia bacterium]
MHAVIPDNEEEYLLLSGIQHFAFCRRQWALIHIEQAWVENLLTTQGSILHEKTHNENLRESRNGTLIARKLRVHSRSLGLSGACDVVEFFPNENGVSIFGKSGTYTPYPVEYKRGRTKISDCDRLQLCAEAMCLEEMLCCPVPTGALFYGETRRREVVEFTEDLKESVRHAVIEMHEIFKKRYTPQVRSSPSCRRCSLVEACLPSLARAKSVESYLKSHLED